MDIANKQKTLTNIISDTDYSCFTGHFEKRKGSRLQFNLRESRIVFVLKGKVALSYGDGVHRILKNREMIVVAKDDLLVDFLEDTRMVCFVIDLGMMLHNSVFFDQLHKDDKCPCDASASLPVNKALVNYFGNFVDHIADDVERKSYLSLKAKELFFLLKAYYQRQELVAFFRPLLSNNLSFLNFVNNNYFKAKNVQELATICNYSLAGFEKKFQRVFGISVYQWMLKKKTLRIYHELTFSEKTLKEISEEQGFTSTSQLNDFCKRNLGLPPGKIREGVLNPAVFTPAE